jgi:hypothetical protein
MLLRVPAGSLKELVAYSDTLNKRKAPYSAVVTKVAFDHTVAHQKLVFKPIRWLDANEIALVAEVQAGTTVASIIGADAAPREDEGDEIAGERPTNAGAVADKAPARAAAAAPRGRTAAKPVAAVEEVAAILEEEPQQQAAAAQAAKPAATVRGFGGSSEAKAAPAAAQAEPKAAPKASRVIDDVNASLDDILASIDD